MSLTVTVFGLPAPQGSKKHVGRGVMVESSARVKPWREDVRQTILATNPTPLQGPIAVEVTFTLPKPASAPKTRTTWPDRRPDLDKLLRSTFDAIGSAGAWRDDAQVVQVTARKAYPLDGTDALDRPGALIRITPAGDRPADEFDGETG